MLAAKLDVQPQIETETRPHSRPAKRRRAQPNRIEPNCEPVEEPCASEAAGQLARGPFAMVDLRRRDLTPPEAVASERNCNGAARKTITSNEFWQCANEI